MNEMSPTAIALIGIAVMVFLIFLGLNVGMSMLLVGVVGYALTAGDLGLALSRLGTVPFTTMSTYSFVVVPLFVVMGEFTLESGMSKGLYDCCERWLGRFRGGLNLATIVANGIFGAICGSSTAAVATIGKLSLPETRRFKYDDNFSAATSAAGGTLSWLIPPSTGFIVYGLTAGNLSIGKLFLSGIVPGILLMIAFMATSFIMCLVNPALAPKGSSYTMKEKLKSLRGMIPVVLLFVIVLGGMFSGLMSYTEAAAAGAVISIGWTAIVRRLTWKGFWQRMLNSLRSSIMVFQIMIAANVFGYFLTIMELPQAIATWIAGLNVAPIIVIMMMFVLYVLIGMVMDGLSAVMLTVPIFCPIVTSLGYDLIWFGCVLVLVIVLGAVTPPVGINLFVAAGLDKSIQVNKLMKYCVPYSIALALVTLLVIFIPKLALWLPNLSKAIA